MNLWLIVDSQQRLSRWLAMMVERTEAGRSETWRTRGASYPLLEQHLRNIGGRTGKGGPAAAEAANAIARLRAFPADTIIEPRVAAGLQRLFDGIDERISRSSTRGSTVAPTSSACRSPVSSPMPGGWSRRYASDSRASTGASTRTSSTPPAGSPPTPRPNRSPRAVVGQCCTQR